MLATGHHSRLGNDAGEALEKAKREFERLENVPNWGMSRSIPRGGDKGYLPSNSLISVSNRAGNSSGA
jgi:hypothetical protein